MKRERTWDEEVVRKWVLKNPGVLTKIALKHRVSHQFIGQLIYGISSSPPGHPIETDLKKAGWPGIRYKGPGKKRRKENINAKRKSEAAKGHGDSGARAQQVTRQEQGPTQDE